MWQCKEPGCFHSVALTSAYVLLQRSPTFLAPGTGFMEDNFSADGWGRGKGDGSVGTVSDGGDGSGSNVSDGERRGATDEALHIHLPLTSFCAAWFLTGRRPVTVRGPGDWGSLFYLIAASGEEKVWRIHPCFSKSLPLEVMLVTAHWPRSVA